MGDAVPLPWTGGFSSYHFASGWRSPTTRSTSGKVTSPTPVPVLTAETISGTDISNGGALPFSLSSFVAPPPENLWAPAFAGVTWT